MKEYIQKELAQVNRSELVNVGIAAVTYIGLFLMVIRRPEFKAMPLPTLLVSVAFFVAMFLVYRIVGKSEKVKYNATGDVKGGGEIEKGERIRNNETVVLWGSVLLQIYGINLMQDVTFNWWRHLGNGCELFCLPYVFAPMLVTHFLGKSMGGFTVVATSLLGMLLVPVELVSNYLVVSLLVGVATVLLMTRQQKRDGMLKVGVVMGMMVLGLGVFILRLVPLDFYNFSEEGKLELGKLIALCMGMNFLLAAFVNGAGPALENVFGIITRLSWKDMADLNHILLKRLGREAPGTFRHSQQVAQLSTEAAIRIGANGDACHAMALFHDIGKLTNPEFFTENQGFGVCAGKENIHDTLAPVTSAQIILKHVTDGVVLAREKKLNPRIVDAIKEHHGTTLVQYFYHKAKRQAEQEENRVLDDPLVVDKSKFQYAGPIPQSRETGILSLADPVESASRSLANPTGDAIEEMVSRIVRDRINSGQLDDSGLTLGEIREIQRSFVNTLQSMTHTRIAYPSDETMRPTGSGAAGKTAPQSRQESGVELAATASAKDASSIKDAASSQESAPGAEAAAPDKAEEGNAQEDKASEAGADASSRPDKDGESKERGGNGGKA